jgi:ketosteroid isomerase-like protein
MSTADEVVEFGRRWAEAEQRGDTETLATMVVDDFTLVGPAGFVLDRGQWLERYRSGDLVTHELVWDQVDVREYGDTAIAIGVHTQRASYRGNPADGSFRGTHIVVRRDGGWMLAGIHLSPIGGPPPFAGRAEG